ncbi:MAG: ElyC/SanA/YdcF family protein [Armatimonadota bacterium]
MSKQRKRTRKLIKVLLILACLICIMMGGARVWVHSTARGRVYTDINKVPKCKVALVLGARVLKNGQLSGLLKDRVDTAIGLYKAGKAEKLLMSGDNRFSHYNEPKKMADYAISQGVPAADVVMDFAGRRTYDSVYRAKHIFGQGRMIIVTQRFHMDRALFICEKLGVEAYGVPGKWTGAFRSKVRELPAAFSAVTDAYILHPVPIMGKKEKI